MYATTYNAVEIAAATRAPRWSLFDRFMTALAETQERRARVVIATYAHLLPDGQEAAGLMRIVE